MRVDDTPQLLGIILDQSFSFNAHIKHVKQSLSSWLWAISYNTCFLGLVETFIMNWFTHFSPLQDRLCCSSMAALALQHQHHQFGSSPKSGTTFDNWATSFYSNQSHLSRIWCVKLLHHQQTPDCLSQKQLLYKTTFLNTLPPAPASAVKLLNFRPSF